jgi:aminoglycoside 3-N-acetyltransferase
MRAFGAIEGGGEAVVQAIRELIGSEGTLLVPAYPGTGSNYGHLSAGGIVLDALQSPSQMGKITETVRLAPGARRSLHPSHSVAALGAAADFYVADHHHSITPCGPGSPFTKLIERKGWVVCLGSPIGRVTSYHVLEDRAASFPVDPYAPGVLTVEVRDASGRVLKVDARAHNPKITPLRIDNNPQKEAEFQKLLTDMQVLRQRRVGGGVISVMRADLLEDALEQLLRQGITIYGTAA